MRGQTRGKSGWFFSSVANTEEVTALFKCICKAQPENYDQKIMYEKFKRYLVTDYLVCRVYILKCKSLTPNDAVNSDPYLVLKCGGEIIDDSANTISNTYNPGFYKCFDLPVEIPGSSILTIQVCDYDGFGRDNFIGETKIDLEERFYSLE